MQGREDEAGVLAQALDRARAGRLAVVLLEGEGGIGKSRLLTETLQSAHSLGMEVASARAEELARTRPFGLVGRALDCSAASQDPRRARIGRLLTAGAGDHGTGTVSSDPGLQFRAIDALSDLVEELALEQPLVIGPDDLQWSDPSSLLAVATMAGRLSYLPLLIIGSRRPFPVGSELQRVLHTLVAGGAQELTLRPLDAAAVTGLVAEAVRAEPGPDLLAELAGAAGNPLFVTELLAAMAEEGSLQVVGGRAETTRSGLPPNLRLTILRRVGFLPEDALGLLRSASILGSDFSVSDLSVITGRPTTTLVTGLLAAVRARVLEEDGPRLRFRHDLIRDAVYQDVPLSLRRALHREAGQRLAATGASALQVAEQLTRAAHPRGPSGRPGGGRLAGNGRPPGRAHLPRRGSRAVRAGRRAARPWRPGLGPAVGRTGWQPDLDPDRRRRGPLPDRARRQPRARRGRTHPTRAGPRPDRPGPRR